jgi:divalent metal cation (Fe/Co/Zn/Cd) transporter
MDRAPEEGVIDGIRAAAAGVPGVAAVEKLAVRKAGLGYYVDIHVHANPQMSLHDAHELSGRVKGVIRGTVDGVEGVLVHMEPWEGPPQAQ